MNDLYSVFHIYVSIAVPEGVAGNTSVSPTVVLTQSRQFCHQENHGRHHSKYLVFVLVLLFNPLQVNPSVHLPSCFGKQVDRYLRITRTHTVAMPIRFLSYVFQTQVHQPKGYNQNSHYYK